MSQNFLKYTYGSLLNPIETFELIKNQEQKPVFEAFMVIVLISIVGVLTSNQLTSVFFLGIQIISYIIFALISWIFVASIIDGLSTIFSGKSNFDLLLVLTAFALLPWILIAPVSLFKGATLLGTFAGITGSIFIWLWTSVLFVLAVAKAYNIPAGSAILLMVMPFLASVIAFFWFFGFIGNLITILAI